MGRILTLHHSQQAPGVAVGYALPSPELRPYVSAYSLTRIDPAAGVIHDQVYPEWANVRFSADGDMAACTGPGPLVACNPLCGIGPTSHATHFSLAPGRYWTIGLLPLGWARLIGAPANAYADFWEVADGASVFARFAPVLSIAATSADEDEAVQRIDAHVLTLLGTPARDEARIAAAHAALTDREVATVTDLADRAGLTVRSLERLSKTAFGFPPQLLLRRQRFLRTLSHFMLDPSLAWLHTLDTHYVDQAHFIRDFRRFMDTTPRRYAAAPHPVLWAAAQARAAAAGTPMQVLQPPAAA